jgi:hypothetical protein
VEFALALAASWTLEKRDMLEYNDLWDIEHYELLALEF